MNNSTMTQSNPLATANGDSNIALLNMFDQLVRTPDIPVDKLVSLYGIMKEMRDDNARIIFYRNLHALQAEMPVLEKTKQIKGVTSKGADYSAGAYVPYEDICKTALPLLQKYGFSISFSAKPFDAKNIEMVATLAHLEGHVEQSAMLIPHDSSGGKNAAQAVGSSVSYGKRNLLVAVLNIVTKNEDDDGKMGNAYAPITAKQQAVLISLYNQLTNQGQQEYTAVFGNIHVLGTAYYNKAEAMLKNLQGNNRLPQYDHSHQGGRNNAQGR